MRWKPRQIYNIILTGGDLMFLCLILLKFIYWPSKILPVSTCWNYKYLSNKNQTYKNRSYTFNWSYFAILWFLTPQNNNKSRRNHFRITFIVACMICLYYFTRFAWCTRFAWLLNFFWILRLSSLEICQNNSCVLRTLKKVK